MSQIQQAKQIIEGMSHRDILHLLNYLRLKTEFIIPKCYSKQEILRFLKSEGIQGNLSEKDYRKIKKYFDSECRDLMNELLRNHLIIALDASADIQQP